MIIVQSLFEHRVAWPDAQLGDPDGGRLVGTARRHSPAIELHLAGLTGQRRRLTLCRNQGCGVAFHDRSRNNSRTGHDVSTCGNLANVRAYRERQRNVSNPR